MQTYAKRCVAISHLIFHSFSVCLRHENARRRKKTLFYCTIVQFRSLCGANPLLLFSIKFTTSIHKCSSIKLAFTRLAVETFFRWRSLNFCALQRDINFSLLRLKSTWAQKVLVDSQQCNRGEFLLPRFESFVQQH